MRRTAVRLALAVLTGLVATSIALGQARMQFPSTLGGNQTAPPPGTGQIGSPSAGGQIPSGGQVPSTYAQPNTSGGAQPSLQPGAAGSAGGQLQPIPNQQTIPQPRLPSQPAPYGQPSTPPPYSPGAPGYGGGGVSPYSPNPGVYGPGGSVPGAQTAPVGPIPGGPYGGISGGYQAPPPYWDPYAPPGAQQPTILPQDPYLPYDTPEFSFATAQKFLQEVRVDYVWLVGHGAGELGVNDAEIYGTFAIPFLRNTQTPLLVTPGFAAHFWEGPVSQGVTPADMPPNTFDAYLEAAWNPQVTPTFGGELAFRVGVYSDFRRIISESIRYQGKGVAVLSLSPNFTVKAGVWYIDRNRVRLLPAGGVIWTPQGPEGNMRFEILFPNPKLALRLSNYRTTEWWLYARGEYGGGAWTIKRATGPFAGLMDHVDYNDLRASVGLEFIQPNGLSGLFEVGVAFERELYYVSHSPEFYRPKETVFLRGSLAY